MRVYTVSTVYMHMYSMYIYMECYLDMQIEHVLLRAQVSVRSGSNMKDLKYPFGLMIIEILYTDLGESASW